MLPVYFLLPLSIVIDLFLHIIIINYFLSFHKYRKQKFKINLEGQNYVHFEVILSRNIKIFGITASLEQIGKKISVKYTWGHRWIKLYFIIFSIFWEHTFFLTPTVKVCDFKACNNLGTHFLLNRHVIYLIK